MNITLKEIIFISIFLVFGKILKNLKLYYKKLFPLSVYKYKYLKNTDINKISNKLYTSIYNNEYTYIVIKIPFNRCFYYHNNDLLFSKNVFIFCIIFLIQYLDNEYISIFIYDDNILFILDHTYSNQLIDLLCITNLNNRLGDISKKKNNYKSVYNKYKGTNKTKKLNQNIKHNNDIEILNTYLLTWLKYSTNQQHTMLFIIYLCYFSKYNNNSNQIILNKYNIQLLYIIKDFFKSIENFKNKKLSDVKHINDNYCAINFKNISNILMYINNINKYLDKNTVIYNIKHYRNYSLLINKIIKKCENTHINHCNKAYTIINKTGFYYNIGIEPYNYKLENNVFD